MENQNSQCSEEEKSSSSTGVTGSEGMFRYDSDDSDNYTNRDILVIDRVPQNSLYRPGLVIGYGATMHENGATRYRALYRMSCQSYNLNSMTCSISPSNEIELEYSVIRKLIYRVESETLFLPERVNYETVQVYHYARHIEIHGEYKRI